MKIIGKMAKIMRRKNDENLRKLSEKWRKSMKIEVFDVSDVKIQNRLVRKLVSIDFEPSASASIAK